MTTDTSEEPEPSLADAMNERASAQGLGQIELADRLDVHQTTVSRWLKGVAPHRKHYPTIADFLGASVREVAAMAMDGPEGDSRSDEYWQRFASDVLQRRQELGLSQNGIAGVGGSTVWKIENGRGHTVSDKKINAVRRGLGWDFVGGDPQNQVVPSALPDGIELRLRALEDRVCEQNEILRDIRLMVRMIGEKQ